MIRGELRIREWARRMGEDNKTEDEGREDDTVKEDRVAGIAGEREV